jgi:hypothetical protein
MRHPTRRLLPMLGMLVLGGCASTYSDPVLPAHHPANPAAEVAAAGEPSRTLDVTGASPAPSQPAGTEQRGDDEAKPAPSSQPAGHEHDGLTPGAGTSASSALYVCPMHPEVTSDKPDQRCPKCGMKLKKKEGAKQP